MTDIALKNPIVTAVLAVKNGEDIAALGTSNPLFTDLPKAWSQSNEAVKGNFYVARLSLAIVASKYPAFQIKNPIGSGKTILITNIAAWSSSGNNVYQIVRGSVDLANAGAESVVNLNTSVSGVGVCTFKKESISAVSTVIALAKGSINTSTADGASITSDPIVISEGGIIQIECTAVGVGADIKIKYIEF
jgi:hypothetical protein